MVDIFLLQIFLKLLIYSYILKFSDWETLESVVEKRKSGIVPVTWKVVSSKFMDLSGLSPYFYD